MDPRVRILVEIQHSNGPDEAESMRWILQEHGATRLISAWYPVRGLTLIYAWIIPETLPKLLQELSAIKDRIHHKIIETWPPIQ